MIVQIDPGTFGNGHPPANARYDCGDKVGWLEANVAFALERDDMGLRDKEAEIEAATGIDIQLTTMAIGPLGESIAQNLRADESAFDIVHVIGFNVAATAGAGRRAVVAHNWAGWGRIPTRMNTRSQ